MAFRDRRLLSVPDTRSFRERSPQTTYRRVLGDGRPDGGVTVDQAPKISSTCPDLGTPPQTCLFIRETRRRYFRPTFSLKKRSPYNRSTSTTEIRNRRIILMTKLELGFEVHTQSDTWDGEGSYRIPLSLTEHPDRPGIFTGAD